MWRAEHRIWNAETQNATLKDGTGSESSIFPACSLSSFYWSLPNRFGKLDKHFKAEAGSFGKITQNGRNRMGQIDSDLLWQLWCVKFRWRTRSEKWGHKRLARTCIHQVLSEYLNSHWKWSIQNEKKWLSKQLNQFGQHGGDWHELLPHLPDLLLHSSPDERYKTLEI